MEHRCLPGINFLKIDGIVLMENWLESSIDGIPSSYLPPPKKDHQFSGMVSWVSLKSLRISLRFPFLRPHLLHQKALDPHPASPVQLSLGTVILSGHFVANYRVDGSEILANKLRLVVYPMIYDGFYASQVVVWDFWTTNRIRGMMYHLGYI